MSYCTIKELDAEFELMRTQELAREKENARVLALTLASCKKRVSKVWYDQMIEFIDFDSGEYLYDFRITDKPCCSHKQKELTRFKHCYFWQACGIAGDDWAGEMSIPIRHGKYLTYNFAS
jgi:hypothetical protein